MNFLRENKKTIILVIVVAFILMTVAAFIPVLFG